MEEKTTERVKAFIRIVALFIAAINAVLTAKGINPIPFDENLVAEVACYLVTGAMALWVWWKNNNVTSEAAKAQKYLNELKRKKKEAKI